jgi:hypothetical protein
MIGMSVSSHESGAIHDQNIWVGYTIEITEHSPGPVFFKPKAKLQSVNDEVGE